MASLHRISSSCIKCLPAFVFLALLLLSAVATEQKPPVLPSNYRFVPKRPPKQPKAFVGRSYFISNDGPLARQLQKDKRARDGVLKMLIYFKSLEKRMKELRKDQQCNVPCTESNFSSARVAISEPGYGVLPAEHCPNSNNCPKACGCVTSLSGTGEGDDDSAHVERTLLYADGLDRIALAAANSVPLLNSNWTKGFGNAKFHYRTGYQTCNLYLVVGFRVDGHWSVATTITNRKVAFAAADWERHYMAENVVLFQNGSLGAFPRTAFKRAENGLPQLRVRATTVYSTWGFRPSPGHFRVTSTEENPAIQDALKASQKLQQQVEDSTTPSNILILILPLAVALVPVCLFADVSKLVAMGYAMVTDVMSVMPLAVKGVELVVFSRTLYQSSRTWAYGMQAPKELGVAVTWAAECSSAMRLADTGAWFVAISILTMVTGIVLEVFAWRKLQWKKTLAATRVGGRDVDTHTEFLWTRERRCEMCDCEQWENNEYLEYATQSFRERLRRFLRSRLKRR